MSIHAQQVSADWADKGSARKTQVIGFTAITSGTDVFEAGIAFAKTMRETLSIDWDNVTYMETQRRLTTLQLKRGTGTYENHATIHVERFEEEENE